MPNGPVDYTLSTWQTHHDFDLLKPGRCYHTKPSDPQAMSVNMQNEKIILNGRWIKKVDTYLGWFGKQLTYVLKLGQSKLCVKFLFQGANI